MTLAHQSSTSREGAIHGFGDHSQAETLPQTAEVTYTYTLKTINPKRKSELQVVKFRKGGTFKTHMELRLFIICSYEELVPSTTDFDIEY